MPHAKKPEIREVRLFETASAWHTWLTTHHKSSSGLWLKLAKKSSGIPSVDYAQAVDVALAWGWIDGQKDKLDAQFWLQRFCPRTPRSGWSKINRVKALALIKAGKMKPAGLEQVERAKSDGRWKAAYDPPSKQKVPEDFSAALAKSKRAAAFFQTINAQNRYAILYRISVAKKPETRARNIAKFVAMLAKGETLYP